jgi:hypothetical protein
MELTKKYENQFAAPALSSEYQMARSRTRNEVSVRNAQVQYSSIRTASKPPTDSPIRPEVIILPDPGMQVAVRCNEMDRVSRVKHFPENKRIRLCTQSDLSACMGAERISFRADLTCSGLKLV